MKMTADDLFAEVLKAPLSERRAKADALLEKYTGSDKSLVASSVSEMLAHQEDAGEFDF
ncbi:hypothetical protein QEZ52_00300 [Aliisedimentitalea scapharcae]|uniref:Uncharacterized protein n=1 Tax=Aliisedimentitalea scapharcae TaxID=1524259 RepID=A0ABZ2XW17_9RHOB